MLETIPLDGPPDLEERDSFLRPIVRRPTACGFPNWTVSSLA